MDTRANYHQALQGLQTALLKMGSDVEIQIRDAVEALRLLDEPMARATVARDDEIDDQMLRIEEKCFSLIALQQPMASDLRTIGMALKIAVDLERIADHAVDIAKIAIRLNGEKLVKPLIDIPLMASIAQTMLRDSLLAYTERNVNRAASLADKDDEVDKIYSTVVQHLTELMGMDIATNRQLTHLLMVAHYLERVADHTTNIGEGVIYMVAGKRKDLNV
ncbi:phosphate signaling complex protein PhoU [Paenibacillus sp. MBLB4367]|uniref:phosphate signaling complex protein PhoU n=1 Tax=Paenibacillus sp. MBLB4367 TaxID=3384767 RepID=UPI0039084468